MFYLKLYFYQFTNLKKIHLRNSPKNNINVLLNKLLLMLTPPTPKKKKKCPEDRLGTPRVLENMKVTNKVLKILF